MTSLSTGIHRFKQELLTGLTGPRPPRHPYDPIAPVSHDIASSVDLLCFDEFHTGKLASLCCICVI